MVYSDKRKRNGAHNIGGYSLKFITHGSNILGTKRIAAINAHIAGRGVYLEVGNHNLHKGFQNVWVRKFM
jgi:hypothetical protein